MFTQHLVSPDICPCSWAGLGVSTGRTPRLSSSCEAKQTCPFAQAVTHSRCAGFKTGHFVVSTGWNTIVRKHQANSNAVSKK